MKNKDNSGWSFLIAWRHDICQKTLSCSLSFLQNQALIDNQKNARCNSRMMKILVKDEEETIYKVMKKNKLR